MRQKNAPKLRHKCVKNARNTFGGEHLLDVKTTHSLKTLTSLNKEVWPFFLGDSSIWSYPSVSSLSDYSI